MAAQHKAVPLLFYLQIP